MVVVVIPKELLRDDLPINQILGKYRSTDQSLSTGTVHPHFHEVTLKRGEIGQKLSIHAILTINSTCLLPEPSRFHREATGERIEVIQLVLDLLECTQPVCVSIPDPPRPVESVVEINLLRRNHPQQRGETLIPYLPVPLGDLLLGRNFRCALEIDGKRRIATP